MNTATKEKSTAYTPRHCEPSFFGYDYILTGTPPCVHVPTLAVTFTCDASESNGRVMVDIKPSYDDLANLIGAQEAQKTVAEYLGIIGNALKQSEDFAQCGQSVQPDGALRIDVSQRVQYHKDNIPKSNVDMHHPLSIRTLIANEVGLQAVKTVDTYIEMEKGAAEHEQDVRIARTQIRMNGTEFVPELGRLLGEQNVTLSPEQLREITVKMGKSSLAK